MKKLPLIFIILLSGFNLFAQNSNIIFSSSINYLPGSNCKYEYYIQNRKTVKHQYIKKSNDCWDLKFNKGQKIDSIPLISISHFIKSVKKNDTLKIQIPIAFKDSLTNRLLMNSTYFKNDSLTIIFSKFKTKYYKPNSTILGSLQRFEGVQIDGNWLTTNFIQNQDTLLTVNKSYLGYPKVSDFKEWLTLYLICNKYQLFQNLQICQYISDENYTYLIKLYLKIMEN